MPRSRCNCPACGLSFYVPDDIVGKQARCPKCHATLTVKAAGGKTVLILSKQSPIVTKQELSSTVAYTPEPDAMPKKNVTRKRAMPWSWVLSAAGCFSVLACGGLGVGAIVLIRNAAIRTKNAFDKAEKEVREEEIAKVQAAVVEAKKLPLIEISPELKHIRFDDWHREPRNLNRLLVTVSAIGESARLSDVNVSQYDQTGKKLEHHDLMFPRLKAGESGEGHLRLADRAVKVVIEPALLATKPQPPVVVMPPQNKPRPDVPPIVVKDCLALHQDFQNNPIAAEKKYAGQLVRIHKPFSFSSKVEKTADGFWLRQAIGVGSIQNQFPVYGVEYKLNKMGEEQYAKTPRNELLKMEIAGTVKGTRPNSANIFSRLMVQVVDCHFVANDRLQKEAR